MNSGKIRNNLESRSGGDIKEYSSAYKRNREEI